MLSTLFQDQESLHKLFQDQESFYSERLLRTIFVYRITLTFIKLLKRFLILK